MTPRNGILIALLITSTASLPACGKTDTAEPLPPSDTTVAQPESASKPEESTPFTLYVSNQSFDDPSVDITITIDGKTVVDQGFEVESQHSVVTFNPEMTAGDHTLRAVSSTGAEFATDFAIPDGEERWSLVSYWFSSDGEPRKFTADISDEPLYFA